MGGLSFRLTRLGLIVVAVAAVACGGSKREAQVAEPNPWTDYKGTYATGVPRTRGDQDPAQKSAAEAKPEPKAAPPAAAPTSAAAPVAEATKPEAESPPSARPARKATPKKPGAKKPPTARAKN